MPTPDRRYLTNWLRRTRRQLAPSGRLSEVALILSQREGGSAEWQAARLRSILEGDVIPSLDELTAIDHVLARPESGPVAVAEPLLLF
jgi:hypothetical protein